MNDHLAPQGATVIGNHWAIANDPEVFPEPQTFNPQRWIDDAGRVRDDLRFFAFAFGFGRRSVASFISRPFVMPYLKMSECVPVNISQIGRSSSTLYSVGNPAAKIDTLAHFVLKAVIEPKPSRGFGRRRDSCLRERIGYAEIRRATNTIVHSLGLVIARGD
ncbi:uncharacterized protein F5147DRAFT_822543 [Suillus discolor]|uniref:Uncharacterized protein n=1 Tax=Suillus discolor TaxID=1912936 RepID=A0A9P7EVC0_9AGAM|nr:uncharacterized protein F5147DRAFT_822543 [Suillus discolor]KAG2092307.1 hypothetical protein F5147DRAFT_822543 [Suillus discolor]